MGKKRRERLEHLNGSITKGEIMNIETVGVKAQKLFWEKCSFSKGTNMHIPSKSKLPVFDHRISNPVII